MCIHQHKLIRVDLHGDKTTVDCWEGGATPRITSGFGSNPPRTVHFVERVGTTDIRCRCLHPITPNKKVCGFSSRFQHWTHGGEHSIGGPDTYNNTVSHTEHHHASQEYSSKQQLQVGDHNYIKNKISHSDRPRVVDRAGIITAIAQQLKQQVFFTTYTGVETWLSPLNICHLSKEEKTWL